MIILKCSACNSTFARDFYELKNEDWGKCSKCSASDSLFREFTCDVCSCMIDRDNVEGYICVTSDAEVQYLCEDCRNNSNVDFVFSDKITDDDFSMDSLRETFKRIKRLKFLVHNKKYSGSDEL